MLSFFQTLFMGDPGVRSRQREHPEIKLQIINFYRVWRNKGYRDFGLERLIRLFLVASQFFFPGLYIRHLGVKAGGFLGRRLAIEMYIVLKMSIPALILLTNFHCSPWVLFLIGYLTLETMLYLSSMIFLSFQFSPVISYLRSLVSIFINFMEISLNYGLLYLAADQNFPHFFNQPFDSGLHAVYFSFITSATIGYGDLYPVHSLARVMVLSQVLFSFVFIGVIFNRFAAKAHERGEYSHLPGSSRSSDRKQSFRA